MFNQKVYDLTWDLNKRSMQAIKDEDYELKGLLRSASRTIERIDQNLAYEDRKMKRALELNPNQYLGFFEMTSGAMYVTDPCYSNDTWCQHKLENVLSGHWYAYITKSDEGEQWGMRVSSIVAYHSQFQPKEEEWDYVDDAHIGVDSGQAGFFDASKFKGQEEDEEMYDRICDLTLSPLSGGVVEHGAASSTGYGDGGYPLYVIKKDNKIVATKIVFISGEGEEEEE